MTDTDFQTALSTLRSLSPMPNDEILEYHPEKVDLYDDTIECLRVIVRDGLSADARREVALSVINSFGTGDGFETYWGALHLIESLDGVGVDIYPIIHQAVQGGTTGARIWGCLLLGRRRDPADLPIFLGCLADNDRRIVVQALKSIKMLAQRHNLMEAIPLVHELVNSSDSRVSSTAIEVLASLIG